MFRTLLDNFAQLNHLAVLVAMLISFVVGWIWYSPLFFGKLFMKLSKTDCKDMEGKSMVPIILGGLFVQWLMTYGLAVLVWGADITWQEALSLTVFVWLGFVVPQQLGGVLWDQKPWGLFFLNTAHYLLAYIVMALVLTLWS